MSGTPTNPWEDVTIRMTVTSPSGKSVTVGGFYYQSGLYKARFAPDEAGTWTWSATVQSGGSTKNLSGSFSASADGSHGFLRVSPYNKYRWLYEDGAPYYGVGLQHCLPSAGNMTNPNNGRLYLDVGNDVDIDTFLSTSAAGGFTFYRWTTDNCSPGLWQTIATTGNYYKEAEARDGDVLVKSAHQHGVSIELTPFNYWVNTPPYFTASSITAAQAQALQRYLQYLIDRYGAYTDIWEIVNEGNASAAWYAAVIPYIKAHDPYGHPVTTSTVYALDNLAFQAGVDLNTMHWYAPVTEFVADTWTYGNAQDWKKAGPGLETVVSETGNCCNVCNYDPTGLRLRNWSAFFGESVLVYWDDARTKTACGGANTNYYVGTEERGFTKILAAFTSGFDPKAVITTDFQASGNSNVRGYALKGPVDYAVYLVNGSDHTNATSGVKVTINPSAGGTAQWINPSTGAILSSNSVPAGRQTLSAPSFTTDIALKIHAG